MSTTFPLSTGTASPIASCPDGLFPESPRTKTAYRSPSLTRLAGPSITAPRTPRTYGRSLQTPSTAITSVYASRGSRLPVPAAPLPGQSTVGLMRRPSAQGPVSVFTPRPCRALAASSTRPASQPILVARLLGDLGPETPARRTRAPARGSETQE